MEYDKSEITVCGLCCITALFITMLVVNGCTESIYIMKMNMDDCDKPTSTYQYTPPPKKESK